MNELLETCNEATSVQGDDCSDASGAIKVLPDLPPIDAQAVYQIALAQIRLHRNRWKASASDQIGFGQKEFDRSRTNKAGAQVGGALLY